MRAGFVDSGLIKGSIKTKAGTLLAGVPFIVTLFRAGRAPSALAGT
jgi:hypothetical protein